MKRIFTLVVVLAAMTMAVQAQNLKFGIKGGFDVAELKFDSQVFNASNKLGWFIGPTIKKSLPVPGLGLDIAGLLNQRSFDVRTEIDDVSTKVSLKQKQVLVPINARYSIGMGETANIFAFAGPQFGFRIGDEGSIKDQFSEWTLKQSNFSVNVGAGFTVSHLQISANYNVGVGKTADVDFSSAFKAAKDGNSTKAWQISATYFF